MLIHCSEQRPTPQTAQSATAQRDVVYADVVRREEPDFNGDNKMNANASAINNLEPDRPVVYCELQSHVHTDANDLYSQAQ